METLICYVCEQKRGTTVRITSDDPNELNYFCNVHQRCYIGPKS